MPERDDDSFLLRWSKRKRGLETEAEATGQRPEDPGKGAGAAADEEAATHRDPTHADGSDVDQAAAADGEANETVPPELSDVDIEALDYDSDFTRFMKDGVPEALKRRALRQLWRSDPILANVDGLNDYDGDFTDAAMVVDVLKTVHKVGRGYLEDDDDETDVDDLDIDDSEDADAGERPDAVAAGEHDADDEVAQRPENTTDDAEPVEPSGDKDAPETLPKKPA